MRLLLGHRSAGLMALAALAWLAGCAVLAAAAGELADGRWYTPRLLAASHLVGLGFLTVTIAGALLHLAPNMSSRPPWGGRWPGLLIWLGAVALASGLGLGAGALEALGGLLLTAGVGGLLVAVAGLWRGRRGSWPEPLAGLVASALWLAGVLLLGLVMVADRRWDVWDVDRARLIGAHAVMATLGWAGGLIVAMATRMAPMMLIAPVRGVRAARAAIAGWHAGVALLVAGLVAGARPPALAGAALIVAAIGAFVVHVAGAARRGRRRPPPAVQHLAAGLAALVAAAVLVLALPAWRAAPAALLLALVGFAAGVTAGHILVMVPTMCWVARFGGLRRGGGTPPPVAHLAPAPLARAEGAAFAIGVALLASGTLAGSAGLARAGALALLVAAAGVVAAIAVAAVRPWAGAGRERVPLRATVR
ncbi:hypothetical protein [Miltoncostaea marina]|uniref:hypothetical protein n=1 Tax=Miltoncostaea marina TaxID=2843215 RepID=UPI001C3C89AE|nr:hypothetical protein [Miltoncostaea marina]